MLRGAASKVMWVGRATVFLVGLAVILAVVFGAASTALGANGAPFLLGKQNFASQVSKLVKRGDGPALSLQVKDGHAPMNVNSSGKVRNLNADQLDGKGEADFYAAGSKVADASHADQADSATNAQNADNADTLEGKNSDQILPLVRSQKDADPNSISGFVDASTEQVNSVSITAPTDGLLVLSSSITVSNLVDDSNLPFTLKTKVDNATTAAQAHLSVDRPAEINGENAAVQATVPVNAGTHTVTVDVERRASSGAWSYNHNNLSVMFVPSARGAVTNSGP